MHLEIAEGVRGIHDEIAVLRVKIKALLEHDPDNIRLLREAANTLARLLRTGPNPSQREGKGIKDALTNVLTELAVSLGLNLGSKIID